MAANLKVVQHKNPDGSVSFTRSKPVVQTLEMKLANIATDYRQRVEIAIEDANDNLNAELTDLIDEDGYSVIAVWDAISKMDDSTKVGEHEIVSSLSEAAEYVLEPYFPEAIKVTSIEEIPDDF